MLVQLLGGHSMQMMASAPQAAKRSVTVSQHMTESMAVLILLKTCEVSVCNNLDNDMVQA
jgi:hypothetical protein